jgi:hypothetical protein
MALDKAALKSALEHFFGNLPNPCTHAACAQAWASTMQSYAAAVVPPTTTAASAAAALASSLATAFAGGAAAAAMDVAFQAFAATLGAGMTPAFVAVPPASPVGWPALTAPPFPASHAAAAARISDALDLWMKTGTATPAIGGPPAPWS